MQVSFIIPAYNEQTNIRSCITSIISECERYNRDELQWEIIVVDNNSTDDTAKVVINYIEGFIGKGLPIFLIDEKKKGVTRARQRGYKCARYNVQAYIDADNRLKYGWLKNLEILNDNLNIGGLSGSLIFDNSDWSFRAGSYVFFHIQKAFHKVYPTMQGGNFVVRREVLDKIGGHSVNFDFFGEDTDLAKRISKIATVAHLYPMAVYSSNRRFANEGTFTTMYKYIVNYFYVNLFNKPFTKEYKDYR